LSSSDTIVPIRGDGCRLPFANKSVDFIFSNAVIEHITKTERDLLAQEIQRVCKKGFFISTPNYWFPVEPHYQIPFFQYIPETVKRFLLRWTSIGSVSRHSNIYAKLLTPKELKKLFPRAVIEEIRILLLPEIIYAYSVEDNKKDLV
jgi:ubiquinone/menaquinone biosynthesis C-methylase UbiE